MYSVSTNDRSSEQSRSPAPSFSSNLEIDGAQRVELGSAICVKRNENGTPTIRTYLNKRARASKVKEYMSQGGRISGRPPLVSFLLQAGAE